MNRGTWDTSILSVSRAAVVLFSRNIPGRTSHGHWVTIRMPCFLLVTSYVYCKTGIIIVKQHLRSKNQFYVVKLILWHPNRHINWYYQYETDSKTVNILSLTKYIERHTAHTIVSWPSPKQWVIVHTSDLMMIIRQSIYILSINTREIGKLKSHSPTYCIMDNWENMLNLTHTLDKIYLTGIL